MRQTLCRSDVVEGVPPQAASRHAAVTSESFVAVVIVFSFDGFLRHKVVAFCREAFVLRREYIVLKDV